MRDILPDYIYLTVKVLHTKQYFCTFSLVKCMTFTFSTSANINLDINKRPRFDGKLQRLLTIMRVL